MVTGSLKENEYKKYTMITIAIRNLLLFMWMIKGDAKILGTT